MNGKSLLRILSITAIVLFAVIIVVWVCLQSKSNEIFERVLEENADFKYSDVDQSEIQSLTKLQFILGFVYIGIFAVFGVIALLQGLKLKSKVISVFSVITLILAAISIIGLIFVISSHGNASPEALWGILATGLGLTFLFSLFFPIFTFFWSLRKA
jgi:predicted small integral membrane protein